LFASADGVAWAETHKAERHVLAVTCLDPGAGAPGS